jgi:hypothetical protein
VSGETQHKVHLCTIGKNPERDRQPGTAMKTSAGLIDLHGGANIG